MRSNEETLLSKKTSWQKGQHLPNNKRKTVKHTEKNPSRRGLHATFTNTDKSCEGARPRAKVQRWTQGNQKQRRDPTSESSASTLKTPSQHNPVFAEHHHPNPKRHPRIIKPSKEPTTTLSAHEKRHKALILKAQSLRQQLQHDQQKEEEQRLHNQQQQKTTEALSETSPKPALEMTLPPLIQIEQATLPSSSREEHHETDSLVEKERRHQHNRQQKVLKTKKASSNSPATPKTRWFQLRKIPQEDLTRGDVLGKGAFGVVYKGEWANIDVVIKQLNINAEKELNALIDEATALVQNNHPNIVRLFGVCLTQQPYSLVMEYASQGSLHEFIEQTRPNWNLRIQIARGIAAGLAYLHKPNRNIVHRDLKIDNVMIDENNHPKIGDFGLAKLRDEMQKTQLNVNSKMLGSTAWLAPELFKRRPKHTTETDMYSYGTVLWAMASGCSPYKGETLENIKENIINGKTESIPEDTPECIKELINKCWNLDPKQRPTAQQAVDDLDKHINEKSAEVPQSADFDPGTYESMEEGSNTDNESSDEVSSDNSYFEGSPQEATDEKTTDAPQPTTDLNLYVPKPMEERPDTNTANNDDESSDEVSSDNSYFEGSPQEATHIKGDNTILNPLKEESKFPNNFHSRQISQHNSQKPQPLTTRSTSLPAAETTRPQRRPRITARDSFWKKRQEQRSVLGRRNVFQHTSSPAPAQQY